MAIMARKTNQAAWASTAAARNRRSARVGLRGAADAVWGDDGGCRGRRLSRHFRILPLAQAHCHDLDLGISIRNSCRKAVSKS